MFIFIYNRSFDIPNVSDYIFKRTAYLVNPPPITELQDRFTMVLETPLSDQSIYLISIFKTRKIM